MDFEGDPLFGGMVRPVTVAGIPQVVLIGLLIGLIVGIWALLMVGAPLGVAAIWIALVAVLILGARVVSERDPNVFRYLYLWAITTWANPGKKRWGGNSSYAAG